MNKIKLTALALMFSAGATYAQPPCDQFTIKVKNNISADLMVTSLKLGGANLQPVDIKKIASNTFQVFTVSPTTTTGPMQGELIFHTDNKANKEVNLQFYLINSKSFCDHKDISPPNTDFQIDKQRNPDSFRYKISDN